MKVFYSAIQSTPVESTFFLCGLSIFSTNIKNISFKVIKTSSKVQENTCNEHWHDADTISDLGSPDIRLSGTEILAKIPVKKSQVKLVLSVWVCVSLLISWPASYLPIKEGLEWRMIVLKPFLQKDPPSDDAYIRTKEFRLVSSACCVLAGMCKVQHHMNWV